MDAFSFNVADAVASAKPNSILDIIPREFFLEIGHKNHAYITSGNYYEWKYAVAAVLKPDSIIEIGVRYGYSLVSFLFGHPSTKRAEGWDACLYDPASNTKARANMAGLATSAIKTDIRIVDCDATSVKSVPGWFDLVHIDGPHHYAGTKHCLNLFRGKCRAILIDDMNNCPDDSAAARDFVVENAASIARVDSFDSDRGELLILMK